jgi:serine phosphatase RsbU (regulator of sigma subunit)
VFCTAVYARLHGRRGTGARLTVCCAGHPLPLVLRRDGTVETVGTPGTLLGFFPDPELHDRPVDMFPGDALVMYTDGVIEERRATGEVFGQDRLTSILQACAGQDAEGIAAAIERRVIRFQPQAPRDDIAILVLRMNP